MRNIIIILFVFFSVATYSQVAQNTYRLYLTDKNNNNYSINNPEEFLSQKAINRRTNQNIDFSINDLPVSKIYTDSLESLGLKILCKSKWMNTVVVNTTNHLLIDTITNLEFIKTVQKSSANLVTSSNKNFLKKSTSNLLIKNDEPYDYGYATTQISMLNGHVLHRNGYKGQGITIAVIDAGFYNVDILPAFDSLWYNNQILGARDFVDGDTQVFDASNHGMKVLSIIGGNIPGQLVGTAPKASFWLLRSEQTESEYPVEEDFWVAAAEFADSVGCDIITSSLGYSDFDNTDQNYSYSDMDGNTAFVTKGADMAASKGILVLNSAGNLGNNEWKYITAPGDGDSVLTVGAVDAFATYVDFSGKGPTSDGRIKPNVVAIGYQTTVQGSDGQVTVSNGTSFSTPIIAGMAACLWQHSPSLNNVQIIQRIEESAHQYSNPDYKMGYGIPDFARAANITSSNILSVTQNAIANIFPNPFTNNLNIELLQKADYSVFVELYNITGSKVFEKQVEVNNNSNIYVDKLDHLPTGIYLLKIIVGSQNIQQRVIKL